MLNNNDTDAEVVFEYTGKGCVVPKDVTSVRFHPSVVEVEYEAFRDCNKLRKVLFNDGLQKIGRQAFEKCTSLPKIKLPSTVTEIGSYAFYHCSNLREVVLSDGLQKIGIGSFSCCTSLSSITLPATVAEIGAHTFQFCSNLGEVVLNDGLKWIGCNAFYNCTSLSIITLPSTVTDIGREAFGNCSNLWEVMLNMLNEVPQKIKWLGLGSPKHAFRNCTQLERFIFPTISTRLDALIQTGHWEEIHNEINEVLFVVERSSGEFFVSTETMDRGRNWNRVREDLEDITRLISYYEIKEATSIFELALWKFKLDQVDEANPIPRKKCRMDVPGPVKDIILQYLPHECLRPVPDIQSSSSESDDNEGSDGDDYESSDDDYY